MTPNYIDDLESIAASANFASASERLVEIWSASNANTEVVESILRFMEAHPNIEFGMPGPLVHFVERFYRRGYEEHLLKSIYRRPTVHTVWMLNRLLNGTKEAGRRNDIIAAMKDARANAIADAETKNLLDRLL